MIVDCFIGMMISEPGRRFRLSKLIVSVKEFKRLIKRKLGNAITPSYKSYPGSIIPPRREAVSEVVLYHTFNQL